MSVTNDGDRTVVAQYFNSLESRTVYVGFSIYFLVLFLSVMPPFFQFVNRVDPIVLGLPFLLFWILFVGVMMSVGLSALYYVETVRGEVV